ncbi:MAG TPA: universal stress protein [Bacteroidales bacterium]|nr:universal stress protein [Bacteroidales bacterium]
MTEENETQAGFTSIPMNKVLIALDFDPTARKVAEAGYSLATALGAKAVLLHVIADDVYFSSLEYSPITGFSGFSNSDYTLMASSEGLARASEYFLESTMNHLGDETIQVIVEQGDFSEMILKAAERTGADLIVMGSHSRRWLDQILMGSVTEKVLHNTSLPLFIVPTKGPSPKKK